MLKKWPGKREPGAKCSACDFRVHISCLSARFYDIAREECCRNRKGDLLVDSNDPEYNNQLDTNYDLKCSFNACHGHGRELNFQHRALLLLLLKCQVEHDSVLETFSKPKNNYIVLERIMH